MTYTDFILNTNLNPQRNFVSKKYTSYFHSLFHESDTILPLFSTNYPYMCTLRQGLTMVLLKEGFT